MSLGSSVLSSSLARKALDVDVDGTLVYVLVLAPHLPEERAAREDAPGLLARV
jgi:hypothetical protein